MKSFVKTGKLDQVGMTASIACAIHCAVLPIAATSLPLLGLEFLANVWVEISMIILSVVIASWSMAATFSRHGSMTPVLLLVVGFGFISSGHFLWHEVEAILIPMGGFTIAAAHFVNWRLNRVCTHKNGK